MSGDVQPRKRKDKRRKKDDAPEIETEPASVNVKPSAPATPAADEFNIHVHNDHGTGGGICAKLVFFILLSIIAVLIGLILVEKRGLTDLETSPTESRFAQIFDGWIDESFDAHDHDEKHAHGAIEEHEEHDDHDEEEQQLSEEAEHDDHDEEEHDDHDEEDHTEEEEDANETDEQASEEDQQIVSQEDDEATNEEEDNTVEEAQSEHQEEEEEDDDDEEEEQVSAENDDDHTEEEEEINQSVDDNDDDDNDDNDEDNLTLEEDDNADTEEDKIDEEVDEATADVSEENDIFEEDVDDSTPDELDEEEVVDNTAGEEEALKEEAEKLEAAEEESTGVAVKIGVGLALVIVAHIVLVRKWRSAVKPVASPAQEEEIISDLSRRNTIVPPVPIEQIENEIDNLEDEYSEEDEEELEDESEEEIMIEPVKSKSTYQQLHSTYSRNLPPENVSNKTNLDEKKYYYDDNEEEEEEEDEEVEEVEETEETEEQEDVEETEEPDEDAEEVEDEEDISDVDDEELLQKLEAKYGKLPSSRDNKADLNGKRIKVLPDSGEESEGSDDGHWVKKETIPTDAQQKMKVAESHLQDNAELSLSLYTKLMEQMPNNVLIKHGRAKALDHLAEKKRSNDLLQDAISSYIDLLQASDISNELFVQVADRCIDRIRFRGHYNRAVEVHKQIIKRFPKNAKFRNQLAVTLLTSNRLAEAKRVLNEVLSLWPEDGFAQVHYGFILKTKDNNLKEAVKYLKNGIQSREPGVIDGRFYFHLGDALTRLGKNQDALKVYEDGVKQNVFLSKYQRSLYNVDRLTARPWWKITETPYSWFFELLEKKWRTIRDEGLSLISKEGFFKNEAENLRDTGEWKLFELFARGVKMTENCKKCPETCKLVENLSDAKGCKRGQVKFSVMHPGTHIWPHCGPSNCRLRAHLGLKVPSGTFIRVAEETRSWKEGKVFIFDDSFEHEVWHNGSDFRLVLIVDVWHPDLTAQEKRALPAI